MGGILRAPQERQDRSDQTEVLTHNDHVFPGNARGKPLSSMAMSMQHRRMNRSVTVHGFRSTFRDWASEQTAFPHESCEHAPAHRISDKAEGHGQIHLSHGFIVCFSTGLSC